MLSLSAHTPDPPASTGLLPLYRLQSLALWSPPLPLMSHCHPLLNDSPTVCICWPPLPLSTPPSGCQLGPSRNRPWNIGPQTASSITVPRDSTLRPFPQSRPSVLLRAPGSSPTVLRLPPPRRSAQVHLCLCLKPLLQSSKGPFSAFRLPRVALFCVCPLTSYRLSSPPLPHPPSQTPTCDLPSLVFNQCAPRLNPESAPKALARAGSAAALPSFCCLADRGARLEQQLTLALGGAAQASPLLLSSGGKIPPC